MAVTNNQTSVNFAVLMEVPKLSDRQSLNIRDFGCARSSEIFNLLKDVNQKKSNNLDSQCMPVHLRRRTSSRKYTQLNKNRKVNKVSKRKFTKTKYKNRSRCSKRKNKIDSDATPLRLATHLWHSKRFHMITRYKYRLPFSTTGKSYRPTFNSIKNGVVLQDISYISPLKIVGEYLNIVKLLKNHIDYDVSISNLRENTILFYESINIEESLIGPVIVSLIPIGENINISFVWAHPLVLDKVFDALNLSNTNIEVNVSRLKNISRFRMIGPLSVQLMLNTFQPIESSKENTIWNDLSPFFVSMHDFPPSVIFSMSVDDKKSKKNYGSLYKSFNHVTHSPDVKPHIDNLLSIDIKEIVVKICGYERCDDSIGVPIIVVINNTFNPFNQPSHCDEKLFNGIDIIFPSQYAAHFLNCFIVNGCKVGGLREYMTITRECFLHSFPDEYPDVNELNQVDMGVNHLSRRKVLKRLKNIDNYDKKIKQCLIDIVTNYDKSYNDFKIIRKLNDDTNYWNNCQLNSFLPIGIIMTNKGFPEKLSMLFSQDPQKNKETKTIGESYIIGYLTDGDISLNMGKGIGKGLVLAKAFVDLKMINNDPKCRHAVLKNSKSDMYHQCKIFISVKLYL